MEEYIIKSILIVTIIIELIILIKKKDRYNLLTSDIFWLFMPWTICLSLYYFLNIKYYISLNWKTFFYIIIFWFFYLLGKYVGQIINNFKNKNINRNLIIENEDIKKLEIKLNLFPIFLLSMGSVVLYVVYMLSINNIVFGVTRNINTNAFATFLLLVSNSSLIIWLYELSYSLLNEKKITYYGWISAIIYNVPCLIISGRDAMIIFIVSTLIVFIYCGNYAKKELGSKGKIFLKTKRIFVFLCIIIISYLIFLTGNRYGTEDDSALQMYEASARCEFPEYLRNIYYNYKGIGKLLINGLFYYSSQFSKIELIYNQYDGPYLGGFFQLHYISRMLPSGLGLNYSLVSSKLSIITYRKNVQGLKIFWDTIIGQFIYDFGRIGSLFAIFLFGIIIKNIQVKYKDKNSIYSILINTFIPLAIFLTIEISPIYDYYYIFPLFWLIVIIKMKKKHTV